MSGQISQAALRPINSADYARARKCFLAPLPKPVMRAPQFALGLLYDNGEGAGRRTISAPLEWYRASAAQGYAKAQYNLALMLEKRTCRQTRAMRLAIGSRVRPCAAMPDAVTRLHGYAESGDRIAQLQLGRMYYLGLRVQRSANDAFRLVSARRPPPAMVRRPSR